MPRVVQGPARAPNSPWHPQVLTGRAGGAPSTAPTVPEPVGSLIDLCDPTPPPIVDAFAASVPSPPPTLMAFEGAAFAPSQTSLQTAPSGNPFGEEAPASLSGAHHGSVASLASQPSTVSGSWGPAEMHAGHVSRGSSAVSLPTNHSESVHGVPHPYAVPPPPQLAMPAMHPHTPMQHSPYTPAPSPYTPAQPHTPAPSPFVQPPVSPEPSDNNPFTENPFANVVAPKPSGAFSFASQGAGGGADDGTR